MPMIKNILLGILYLFVVFLMALGGYVIKGIYFTELTADEKDFIANTYIDRSVENGIYYLHGIELTDKENAYNVGKELLDAYHISREAGGLVQMKYSKTSFNYKESGLRDIKAITIIENMLSNDSLLKEYKVIYSKNIYLIPLIDKVSQYSNFTPIYDLRKNSIYHDVKQPLIPLHVMYSAHKVKLLKTGVLLKEKKYTEVYKYIFDNLNEAITQLNDSEHEGLDYYSFMATTSFLKSLKILDSKDKLTKLQRSQITNLVDLIDVPAAYQRNKIHRDNIGAAIFLETFRHVDLDDVEMQQYKTTVHAATMRLVKARMDALDGYEIHGCYPTPWPHFDINDNESMICTNPFYNGNMVNPLEIPVTLLVYAILDKSKGPQKERFQEYEAQIGKDLKYFR